MYDLRLSNADSQGIRAILSRISYNTRKTVPTFLDGSDSVFGRGIESVKLSDPTCRPQNRTTFRLMSV